MTPRATCRLGLAGLLFATACSASDPSELPQATAVRRLEGAGLVEAGVLGVDDLRRLLPLGEERGWTLAMTPAGAGPEDTVTIVGLGRPGAPLPDEVLVRLTADGWQSSRDRIAQTIPLQDRPSFFLELPARSVGTQVEFAVRARVGRSETWLDARGQNFAYRVIEQGPLQWVGDRRAEQDGLPIQTDVAYSGHDVDITVHTYPPNASTDVSLFVRNDAGTVERFPMWVTGAPDNNLQWRAILDTSDAEEAEALEYWIRAEASGEVRWDSNDGRDYALHFGPPPAPQWGQAGVFTFSRVTEDEFGNPVYRAGWYFRSEFADPLDASPGQYQAYASAPRLGAQVYIPGITDVVDPYEAPDVAEFIDVEVYSPFFSGTPNGPWIGYPMDFVEVAGNDFRFDYDIRLSAAPLQPPIGVDFVEDGIYPYKIRVSTDGGVSWSWLGTEGFPFGGENLRIDWENRYVAPYITFYEPEALQTVDVGDTWVHEVQLVNTTNATVVVEAVRLSGADEFVLGPVDLPVTLESGERLSLDITVSPQTPGASSSTLEVDLYDIDRPNLGRGTRSFTLERR